MNSKTKLSGLNQQDQVAPRLQLEQQDRQMRSEAKRLASKLKKLGSRENIISIFRQAAQSPGLIQMILPYLLKEQLRGIKKHIKTLSDREVDDEIKQEYNSFINDIAEFQNQNQKKQPAQEIQKKQPIQEIQKEHCFWATLKDLWKIFKWEMSILAAITVYYVLFQIKADIDQRSQVSSSCKALEANQFQCTPGNIGIIKNTCSSVNQPKTALTLWFWIPVVLAIILFIVLICIKIYKYFYGPSEPPERLEGELIKKKQSKNDSKQQNMFNDTLGHNKNESRIGEQPNDEQEGQIPDSTYVKVKVGGKERKDDLREDEDQRA